jgi:hypothetical protein
MIFLGKFHSTSNTGIIDITNADAVAAASAITTTITTNNSIQFIYVQNLTARGQLQS